MTRVVLILLLATPFLFSCGGKKGGSTCEDALSIEYVIERVASESIFTDGNVTLGQPILIHEDADDGSSPDLHSLILAKAIHDDGDTLLVAYSGRPAIGLPGDTLVAFYIDIDNDSETGEDIDGVLGADRLILDKALAFGVSSQELISYYYTWSGTEWLPALPLDVTAAIAIYRQGCVESSTILLPLSNGLADLYGVTGAKGIIKLIRMTDFDPDAAGETIEATSVFLLDFP